MLIGVDDPLPLRPQRVLVAGTSGAGKTTVAGLVAARSGLPRFELDALFHGPGWTELPSFRADVERFAAGPRWVCEWQYGAVQDLLADRADLLVWLDLPRARVLTQVTRRTLSRRIRRTELWNGNVEPPLWTVFTDPEHIVRWAWSSQPGTRDRVAGLLRRRPALPVVALGSRREVTRWLDGPLRAADQAPEECS